MVLWAWAFLDAVGCVDFVELFFGWCFAVLRLLELCVCCGLINPISRLSAACLRFTCTD